MRFADASLRCLFSNSLRCLFALLIMSFKSQMFLTLMSHLSIFAACAFDVICKKSLSPVSQRFLPVFFSFRSNIVLDLTFRSRAHFE